MANEATEKYAGHVLEKFLLQLENEARPGESILVVTKWLEDAVHHVMASRDWVPQFVRKNFELGVLSQTKPTWWYSNGVIYLSPEKYVRKVGQHLTVLLGRMAITPISRGHADLSEPLAWIYRDDVPDRSSVKPDLPIEVVIGDASNQQYCAGRGPEYMSFYLSAVSRLDIFPGNLVPQLEDFYVEQRKKAVEELEALCEEQKRFEAGSRSRKGFSEIEYKMKAKLETAVELNLHKTAWDRTYAHIPGMRLQVQQFIVTLCQRLGVRMP